MCFATIGGILAKPDVILRRQRAIRQVSDIAQEYRATIAHGDDQLGNILNALKKRPGFQFNLLIPVQ